jgi:hypothetical protein
MLADLNLFIRTRGIFVFPLQEVRGRIPIGDLYHLYFDSDFGTVNDLKGLFNANFYPENLLSFSDRLSKSVQLSVFSPRRNRQSPSFDFREQGSANSSRMSWIRRKKVNYLETKESISLPVRSCLLDFQSIRFNLPEFNHRFSPSFCSDFHLGLISQLCHSRHNICQVNDGKQNPLI